MQYMVRLSIEFCVEWCTAHNVTTKTQLFECVGVLKNLKLRPRRILKKIEKKLYFTPEPYYGLSTHQISEFLKKVGGTLSLQCSSLSDNAS
jgi:hypothetical protein